MSTKSCIEFHCFTSHGVVLAHRARFVASLRQDDDVLERKRVYVRLGALLDACAIARHHGRRVSSNPRAALSTRAHAARNVAHKDKKVSSQSMPTCARGRASPEKRDARQF